GQSGTWDRTRVGEVTPVEIVGPPLVATGVDGGATRRDAQEGVSPALVDPSGLDVVAGGVDVPSCRRIAQRPTVPATRRGHDEVVAVRGCCQVAHVRVEGP